MRDINRIDPFLERLGKVWKKSSRLEIWATYGKCIW